MNITVLGAGVIGVTTAYYLALSGHKVTVIDRQPGPALETSFANAGQISPGYSSPWAAPGIPQKALRWLMMEHAPLILRPSFDAATFRFLCRMLQNCTHERYAVNKIRMVRLADYARDCLRQLRQDTGIEYDQRTLGTLEVFRTQKQFDAVAKDVEVLKAGGIAFERLDARACAAIEPGLAHSHIVGGLRLPEDETGDCFKFTAALSEKATEIGVRFDFNTTIRAIRREGDRIRAVETDRQTYEADMFVVALGSYTPSLLRPLELDLPVYPVKGYSMTMPVADTDRAPVSTVMDEAFKIAITRLGGRIRVGGMAEIGGFSHDLPPKRLATLVHSLKELFPHGGDLSQASFWTGLRPMTPDGTPIVGPTRYTNLFINTGHGTLGWTMSCGSAKLLADLINQQTPEIPASDYRLVR